MISFPTVVVPIFCSVQRPSPSHTTKAPQRTKSHRRTASATPSKAKVAYKTHSGGSPELLDSIFTLPETRLFSGIYEIYLEILG